MGKAWSLQLWQRACHKHDPCSYGFIPGRTTEGAILQVKCALWRARRTHRSTVACLWDVSNAFPSISHTALDLAVDEVHDGQDAVLAKDRHISSLVILKDSALLHEIVCVAPGQGDRQGDGPAPQKFIAAYDKMTNKLIEKE
eukprot:8780984-Heterocapsa_arctica.AAC.1